MLDQKVTQFFQKLPKKKSKQFLFKICDIFHDNDQSPEVFGYFWKKIYHPDILKLAKSDPHVYFTIEKTCMKIINGCGEFHVEICIKDLK